MLVAAGQNEGKDRADNMGGTAPFQCQIDVFMPRVFNTTLQFAVSASTQL